MTQVLALNGSFEPFSMLTLKQALRLVYQGKATIVEGDEQVQFRSEKSVMPRPLVVRLERMVRPPKKLLRSVSNTFLFGRDKYTCQYCGRNESQLAQREGLEREHIVPRSRGGKDVWTNVVTACSTCNARKRDRTPEEAGMKLLSVPKEPDFMVLKWTVRRLTPLQRKYIVAFYGEKIAAQFADT